MSWFSRAWSRMTTKRDLAADVIGWQYRYQRSSGGSVHVTPDTALRHSAVWACLRLRADLLSMMPVDVYRQAGDRQVEVTKPGWLVSPFEGWSVGAWLWGSQFDLDRYGNAFGLITKVDSAGRVAELEPLSAADVTVVTKGRRIVSYRVLGDVVDPKFIWHERQYQPAGVPLGLSPIAYAAWSVGGYLSAQQFALDWYQAGAAPSGVLRNTVLPQVSPQVAQEAKAKFKSAVQDRDLFVTGKDWEWVPAAGDASSAAFLDEMKYGVTDVCRFLGVPADMIDAPSEGSNVTYANVTQRNVQLLVINLGPAVKRREDAFSAALSAYNSPVRFVKLNTDAVLRMDPATRAQVMSMQIQSRLLLPSEGRALDNRAPYTESDYAEFDRLFTVRRVTDAVQSPVDMARMLMRPDFEPPRAIGWQLPRELESGDHG